MPSTSQNGWPVIDRKANPELIATYTVPGTEVRLPLRVGNVATVLLYVAERWHNEVEPLHAGWCWGFAARLIRGSTTTASNHASASAIDLNAPAHPLATAPASNFTAKQITAIRKIVADLKGVVRWGGDYSGRKDGMHLEINAGSARVAEAVQWIRAQREAKTPTKSISRTLVQGSPYHRQVMLLQRTLDALPGISLVVDGDFGPATASAVKKFKANSSVALLRNDRTNPAVGPLTVRSLGLKWTGK